MGNDWQDRVRERAYGIWEREGRPEGGAERHWAQAEEELRAGERGGTEAPAVEAARTAREAREAGRSAPWGKRRDAAEAPAVEAARTAREAREATAAEPGPAPTTVPHA